MKPINFKKNQLTRSAVQWAQGFAVLMFAYYLLDILSNGLNQNDLMLGGFNFILTCSIIFFIGAPLFRFLVIGTLPKQERRTFEVNDLQKIDVIERLESKGLFLANKVEEFYIFHLSGKSPEVERLILEIATDRITAIGSKKVLGTVEALIKA